MIRDATNKDAAAIAKIYNHYILHSHSTFEIGPIDENEMISRIERVQNEFHLPWLVLEEDGIILGYAYATQWKARVAYSKTTETSIYLQKDQGGKGYGKPLYSKLMSQLKTLGYHAIIDGMSLPNEASRVLHEKLGFKKIGEFKEVGYKFDRWIDVGYWELIL
ncbi:phosphinothricin acetyltransferase [Ekhidna lutea]|uniref:Phosphinothricin acetyltransferase n=1 Tax=Ekhidna lutea TaxID=447679 RepID=A0A239EDP6_EKHLU|nr:GNAT family N-acetyltransferase [Ekhidna lutea]SNS42727.1 phosphinothricin acetyltransferase [Ekhidna lutea]